MTLEDALRQLTDSVNRVGLLLEELLAAVGTPEGPGKATAMPDEPLPGCGELPAALSVDAAARALSVSTDTVYALIRTGELRSVLVKRRHIVPRDAIEQLLAGQVKANVRLGELCQGCRILVACCLA